MPSSGKNCCRVIGVIPSRERQRLLRRYAPAHLMVYAHHITLAYRVPRDQANFPKGEVTVRVIGMFRDERCDLLFLSVNGQHHRPDGRRYHLTLSVAEDLPPAQVLTRAGNAFTPIEGGEVFRIRFQQAALRVDTPSYNLRLAA